MMADDCRFTIRLTAEEMAHFRRAMKRHRIRKKTALVRKAVESLEREDGRRERGEIVVRIPKKLIAFMDMKKDNGYVDYSHIIADLLRSHFEGRLEEIKATNERFNKVYTSIVKAPEAEEEMQGASPESAGPRPGAGD